MKNNDNEKQVARVCCSKGTLILLGVYVASLLVPLCVGIDQYSFTNLPGGASWWGSLGVLILGVVLLMINRKKHWLCLPPAKPLAALLGICLLLTILTAPHVAIEPEITFHCFAFLLALCCLAWLLLRKFCVIILLPLLLLGIFETGAYYSYKVLYNSVILAEALECSKTELLTYVTVTNITLLIAAFALIGGLLYLLCRVLGSMSKRSVAGLLVFVAASVYLLLPFVPYTCSSFSQVGFAGTYKRVNRMFKDLKRAKNSTTSMLANLPSPADKPSSIPALSGEDGCVVVFHIGESVRGDRCGYSGYSRNTTPHLSANPHLVYWKRCVASTSLTISSLAVLLTDARRGTAYIRSGEEGMNASCGSVLDLFKANGFAVHCFQGALHRQSLRADSVLRLLTSACDARHSTQEDVMESVDQIKDCLQKTGKRNLFILVNNEGSHAPFYMYDQKNPPFTPSLHVWSPTSNDEDAVRNAYDNTIHYTDLFVHRVLQQLKGRPFVYVYVSDHGEYLGDYDGTWGRARASSQKAFFHQTQGAGVSAFVVTSPEFESLHPRLAGAVAQLRKSQHLTIGHEHFFHTLLGLVGVETPYYQAKLDLCSPEAEAYTGPQPSDWPDYLKEAQ